MAGQPMKNPNDAQKFREQYLANLELRARLDDLNLQANKTYLRTGSLPVEVSDFRNTEEKLRDRQFVAKQVQSALKEIMTGNNAQRAVSQMTSAELQFYAQSSIAINNLIRPQYKLGVLAEIFVPFLRQYMRSTQRNMNVITGLQQTSGNGIVLNAVDGLVRNADLIRLQDKLRDLGNAQTAINAIEQLRSVLPPPLIFGAIAGISDPMLQANITTLLNASLQNIPNRQTFLDTMSEIETAINMRDPQNSRRVVDKVVQLFTLGQMPFGMLRRVKQLMGEVQSGQPVEVPNEAVRGQLLSQERDLLVPAELVTNVSNTGQPNSQEVMTMERLTRADMLFQEQTDNRPDGVTEPLLDEFLSRNPTFDLPVVPTAEGREVPEVVREAISRILERVMFEVEDRFVEQEVKGLLDEYVGQVEARSLQKVAEEEAKKVVISPEKKKRVLKSITDYFKAQPRLPRPPPQRASDNPMEYSLLNDEVLKRNNYGDVLGGFSFMMDGNVFKPIITVLDLDMRTFDFDRASARELMDIARVYKTLFYMYGKRIGLTEQKLPPTTATKGVSTYKDRFNTSREALVRVQRALPDFLGTLEYFEESVPRPPRQASILEPIPKQRDTRGEGIRGMGLIQKEYPFGKYIIKGKQLNDDIVNLQYNSHKKLKKFPTQKVSSQMGKILRTIAGNGVPNYEDMESLSQPEKVYLHKLAKESDLIGRFSIPTPDKTKEDQEKDEFNLLKGQILSGNDNAELVKKFKSLLIRLSTRGDLPKSECREILMDLVAMGY